MEITLCYIPCPSDVEAKRMRDALLEKKLVACTHIFPVNSSYPWQGVMETAGEFILLIKTFPECESHVIELIQSMHSYEIPAILHWHVRVNAAYFTWMQSVIIRP
jgi:periplasmic divalent cation tolerance protein